MNPRTDATLPPEEQSKEIVVPQPAIIGMSPEEMIRYVHESLNQTVNSAALTWQKLFPNVSIPNSEEEEESKKLDDLLKRWPQFEPVNDVMARLEQSIKEAKKIED